MSEASSTQSTQDTESTDPRDPAVRTDDKRNDPRKKSKMHTRTPSYNKISTMNVARPNLNRSKSTDGVVRIKRNNRSYTKIANLQPLTKTLSNQSLKSNKSNTSLKNLNINLGHGGLKLSTKQGRAILRLNDDNDDYEDLSGEEEPEIKEQDLSLEQVFKRALGEEMNQQSGSSSGQSSQQSVQQSGQSTREPTREPSDHFEQQKNELNNHIEQQIQLTEHQEHVEQHANDPNQLNGGLKTGLNGLNGLNNMNKLNQYVSEPDVTYKEGMDKSLFDSSDTLPEKTEDLTPSSNLYGGSLFLSQSTGLIRKIDPKSEYKEDHFDHVSDLNSGISFKANGMELAEPIITEKNALKENSYQPNQTIFNNLQRTNSQYVNTKRQLQQQGKKYIQIKDLNGANNFANFLTNNNMGESNSNDNRTQQRLWLQRENSLKDVSVDPNQLANFSSLSLNKLMFAHNYNQSNTNLQTTPNELIEVTNGPTNSDSDNSSRSNSHTKLTELNQQQPENLLYMMQNGNPIQSRIEFERLNREYLNVRRYLNPVGESLNRVKNNTIQIDKRQDTHTNSGNTFQEFSPEFEKKEVEITNSLNKIWQDALLQSSIIKPVNGMYGSPARPQRLPSRTYMNRNTPTTRAVKLAQSRPA